MNHVRIDDQEDAVKRFALALATERGGAIVELGGKEVLQVYPAIGNGRKTEEWTDALNDRRCELIDKEVEGSLNAAEQVELENLQEQMLRYRHRIAPLPMAHASLLLEELEKKASQSTSPST